MSSDDSSVGNGNDSFSDGRFDGKKTSKRGILFKRGFGRVSAGNEESVTGSSDESDEDEDESSEDESKRLDAMDDAMDEDEDDADARPSFGGLGASRGGNAQPKAGQLLYGNVNDTARHQLGGKQASLPAANHTQQRQKYNPLGTNSKAFQSTPSVDKNFAAFEKNTKGIGLKLLKKMGYVPGQGLGKDGAGIVNPIDVKLRPSGIGLGMIDERSEAVRLEKKSTAPGPDAATTTSAPVKKEERWKKQGIKKRKPTYKMATEVIQEEMSSSKGVVPVTAMPPTASRIRDLRGEEEVVFSDMQSFSSAQQLNSGVSLEHLSLEQRLPELRHNLKLIAEISKRDLLYISRQIKLEQAARETRFEEVKTSTNQLLHDKQVLDRSVVVQDLVKDIQRIAFIHTKDLTLPTVDPSTVITQLFGPLFSQLLQDYQEECRLYKLDHLVCGVVACVVKTRARDWKPLEDPLLFGTMFAEWGLALRRVFKIAKKAKDSSVHHSPDHDNGAMSAFDTVLYTMWLPKVRQAINNDWNPQDPDKVIEMLEFYKKHEILPDWFFSNIIVQLILPKLERYLDEYKIMKTPDGGGEGGYKIHIWLFPWLPLLGGETMRPLWRTVRRKVQVFLQNSWEPTDPVAMDLVEIWSQVWENSETQALLTNSILPRLVVYLRHTFTINPSAQDLDPLLRVFGWSSFIPSHLFSHLLETEFFRGWTTCLWTWITSPQANLDEISQWYTHWKKLFSDYGLEKLDSCKHGFKTGLDMMNQGVSASFTAGGSTASFIPSVSSAAASAPAAKPHTAVLDMESITFKDMVAEMFAESSVEFVPIGKRHRETGKDLYKLGKKIHVYIDDGVLYCSTSGSAGEFKFMSVDDAITLAQS